MGIYKVEFFSGCVCIPVSNNNNGMGIYCQQDMKYRLNSVCYCVVNIHSMLIGPYIL